MTRSLLLMVVGAIGLLLSRSCGSGETEAWREAVEFPRVDLTGLTRDQREVALGFLRGERCGCGCSLVLAECALLDPNCPAVGKQADAVILAVRSGWSREAIQRAARSAFAIRELGAAVPGIERERRFPFSAAGRPVFGAPTASSTLVVFVEYMKPTAAGVDDNVTMLVQLAPAKVRVVVKQFPRLGDLDSMLLARAALAAHAQDRFLEFHHWALKQESIGGLRGIARWVCDNDFDEAKFLAEMSSARVATLLLEDGTEGQNAGLQEGNVVFLEGARVLGMPTARVLRSWVEQAARDLP